MIVGRMTEDNQPLVPLVLYGPDGQSAQIEGVLDTGFTENLMLPQQAACALGLAPLLEEVAILADGSPSRLTVYEVGVLWDDEERAILIYGSDGKPLLGAKLLDGSLVTLEYVAGGSVTIEPAQ